MNWFFTKGLIFLIICSTAYWKGNSTYKHLWCRHKKGIIIYQQHFCPGLNLMKICPKIISVKSCRSLGANSQVENISFKSLTNFDHPLKKFHNRTDAIIRRWITTISSAAALSKTCPCSIVKTSLKINAVRDFWILRKMKSCGKTYSEQKQSLFCLTYLRSLKRI